MNQTSTGKPRSWHFITGEYPPQPGGVGDYNFHLARELAALGDEVHVWAPPAPRETPALPGVLVHRLRGHFGAGSLSELTAGIDSCPPPRRLFIEYVAGAFGFRAMNLPFCLWVRRRRKDKIWVMFHEYAYAIGWNVKPGHNLLGVVTRLMGRIVAMRADRIFVSTPAWNAQLPRTVRASTPSTWLPIPSNIPSSVDSEAVAVARRRVTEGRNATLVGHFGTYSPLLAGMLLAILPSLLAHDPKRVLLLMGRGGERFGGELGRHHPHLKDRIVATGGLPDDDLAAHIRACDVLIQPYPDGVTSRRGSLMAGLALGLPIVSNLGALTGPTWSQQDAVLLASDPSPAAIIATAEDLLSSPSRWPRLGHLAAALYEERFSMRLTVETIRRIAREDDGLS
jgi:glycosyltransferase involved in cell wall biosynthesis